MRKVITGLFIALVGIALIVLPMQGGMIEPLRLPILFVGALAMGGLLALAFSGQVPD